MYAFCQDMPGISVEEQHQLAAMLPRDALARCLVHLVGPMDGGCRMIDVWESEDDYRTFQRQHLWPALQQWMEQRPAVDSRGSSPFSVVDVNGDGFARGVRA